MKKIFFLLAALLVLLGATACSSDSNKTGGNTAMTSMVVENRIVPAQGNPVLSATNYTVTINYGQNTITVSGSVKMPGGNTVQFITPDMKMNLVSEYTYNFTAGQMASVIGGNISGISGTYDFNTNILYIAFQCDDCHVYASRMVQFPYSTTIFTDTTQSVQPLTTESSGYLFDVGEGSQITYLTISYWGSEKQQVSADLYFTGSSGIDTKITADGYTFSADTLTGHQSINTNIRDTLYDVRGTVSNQGRTLNLTYRKGKYKATARGYMFVTHQ